MGLSKLEEVFDFMSSQVNSRQEGVMTHGAPPSLVGRRSHRTRLSLFTTHQPMSPIPVSTARHSSLPFLRAWNEFTPACTEHERGRCQYSKLWFLGQGGSYASKRGTSGREIRFDLFI